MKRLICLLAVGGLLAACASKPEAPPPGPVGIPATPQPIEKPESTKYILQSEAEQLCVLEAVRRDGVRIGDVSVSESKKVDAGFRSTLQIGGTERTCIVTPSGSIRSYQ